MFCRLSQDALLPEAEQIMAGFRSLGGHFL